MIDAWDKVFVCDGTSERSHRVRSEEKMSERAIERERKDEESGHLLTNWLDDD